MVFAITFGISSCKSDFDLDKKFPEWLGTSIYETLQVGFKGEDGQDYTFNYFVQMIDSLNLKQVLAKTGSKTLFVASDAAFDRFFGPNCPFKKPNGEPVMSFNELSKAQMSLILNGSMLNNVYQVASLSTSGGNDTKDPVLGDCMRRISASSVYDSIPIMHAESMPKAPLLGTDYWRPYRTKTAGIPILQDGTIKPIVFFVPKFLTYKKITDRDYDFLFNQGEFAKNGQPGREPQEASVNGTKIETQNKKCFNGFIHVMSEVVYLTDNMAEYLENSDNAVIYSSIIDRFAVPFYDASHTDQITKLIAQGEINESGLNAALSGLGEDSIFVKRYYSRMNQKYANNKEVPLTNGPDGRRVLQVHEVLKFDPGWNGYFIPDATANDGGTALMQHDMGVMIVPTDAALTEWWLEGGGVSLRQRYGLAKYRHNPPVTPEQVAEDMDSIDIKVIVKLLNNNMLSSLVNAVPSKFAGVLNDANDPMFENPAEAVASIDSVVMCCNGAIYFTNKIYAPTAYRSVSYPTLVNERLQILNTAIEDKLLSFDAYLNSMSVPCYSFFVPVVNSDGGDLNNKLVWLDPVSFALEKSGGVMQAVVFGFNETKKTIEAEWHDYDPATNTVDMTKLNGQLLTYTAPPTVQDKWDTESQIIMNRLGDLLNYHIVIGDVEANIANTDINDYRFFPTKGRGTVRVKTVADPKTNFANIEVDGGWQIETGQKVNVLERFDFSRGSVSNGNGRTYLIDRPLLTSRKSVYDILSDSVNYPEFKRFFDIVTTANGVTEDVIDPKTKKVLIKANPKPMFASQSNKHEIGAMNCVSTFDTYHYTVYVPTNEAIDKLFADKVLYPESYMDSLLKACEATKIQIQIALGEENIDKTDSIFADSIMSLHKRLTGRPESSVTTAADSAFNHEVYVANLRIKLMNFVKYHIQDNAVYCNAEFNVGKNDDGTDATNATYETAFMDDNDQFTKLNVAGGTDVTVIDQMGNTRHVLKNYSGGDNTKAQLWNIMCREYEYSSATVSTNISGNSLETSSYAVIHQIDGALMHDSFMEP